MEIFGHRMRKYIDFQGYKLLPFGTPMPLHGVNPRSMLDSYDWDMIRKQTYSKYNYKCAICGDTGLNQGFSHPVEAHEIWDYDFDNYVQYFEGLVALCPICHKVIHWQQNRMSFQNGGLEYAEFTRQEELKRQKVIEVTGTRSEHKIIKPFKWHDANWKSDFSKLKELYPRVKIKILFDTKYNGYFEREEDDYVFKPSEGIKDLF